MIALLGLLGLLTALLAPFATGPAAAAGDDDPALTVRITSLNPAVIPRHGRITIDGVIRNDSSVTWKRLNVYPLTSPSPMTDRAAVEAAALTDPNSTDFGQRLLPLGVPVGNLVPGASTTFHLKVPRSQLQISGAPGVYWLGVHVLGESPAGRDGIADGRARTFIPLLPHKAQASVAMVLPIRAPVRRADDGTLRDVQDLAQSFSPSGRLGRIAAFGQAASGNTLTWLVDPAVLDAAQDIVDGNPPLGIGAAKPGQRSSPSPSPSSSTSGANGAAAPELTDQDRANARTWLRSMTTLMRNGTTLALPYGDPDVSALGDHHHVGLLKQARALSTAAFRTRGIPATPAVAPIDGYLDPAVVRHLAAGVTVLLSDHGQDVRRPVVSSGGRRFVSTDARTSAGGPLPAPQLDSLSLRQRIASDAAIESLQRTSRTLIVSLPANWNPDDPSAYPAFYAGLDPSWLQLQSLPAGEPVRRPTLSWPHDAVQDEIPLTNARSARQLAHLGSVLGQLVDVGGPQPDSDAGAHRSVTDRVTGAALAAVSYDARADPIAARLEATELADALRILLAGVRLIGTQFVTLSGESGVLTVSMLNGLDVPIKVTVRARTGNPDITIEAPHAIQLAAGQRTTVRLVAHARAIGVHEVALTPITTAGQKVGTALVFNLRTSQVGMVFWVIMGAGLALLVVMVLRQVRRRLRERKAAG